MELKMFLSKLDQFYAKTVTAPRCRNDKAVVCDPGVDDSLADRVLASLGISGYGGQDAPA